MRAATGAALAVQALRLPELHACTTVAAYLSIGTEPPTQHLLQTLLLRGVRVLTPVLRPDHDLDWTEYDETRRPVMTSRGLREPAGERLGVDAVATVGAVIVPALAVDECGMRLGRGGGSYDRALARVPPRTPTSALLSDGEVVPDVPAEPHDRPVDIAVTPSRVWRFYRRDTEPHSGGGQP